MLLVKTPVLIMKLFPDLIWHFKGRESKTDHIYLTFDDGPTPDVTAFVLDQLKQYEARATFFCLGRNADKYPEIYQQVVDEGHAVGNHTYSHLKGWQTDHKEYVDDVKLAGQNITSKLFRPPYGRFKNSQIREISKDYDVVMWDVLSLDYNQNITPGQCLDNVRENLTPGSIVVFHDSLKASKNLYHTLPRLLDEFSGKFKFLPIEAKAS